MGISMGSKMHQRIESQLGPDGRPGAWNGNSFLLVAHQVNQRTDPTGREEKVDCNHTTEFVPTGEDATEIIPA
jgi:hypothetical protein